MSKHSSDSGEFVQVYTRRGSPMRGKFRWRTHRDRLLEYVAAFLIASLMLLGVALPALLSMNHD